MFDERSCDKCNGKEFKIILGGAVSGGAFRLGAAANDDHWFCPDCSWGSDEPPDAAA